MRRVNIDNNIYFICRGTSTNDIIESINLNKETKLKETKSFFDLFNANKNKNNKNIKKEEFSTLDMIGINELNILTNNEENKTFLNNKLSTISEIYTSLEYSSIESALIITKDIPNIEIFPLSYLSNKTNIKNKNLLYFFKNKFGDKYNRTIDRTNVTNYWKDKIHNNNFINLKSITPLINWTYLDNSIGSLNSYNLNKVIHFIKLICEKAYYDNDYKNNSIIISDGKLIEDILKLCKDVKYNKKRYTIERSSIWEINISGYIMVNSINKIISNEIKFNIFKKIYPTEYNYKPLKHNNNNFSYEYNYNKYILFNSLQPIPLKYIKNMELTRIGKESMLNIIKILNKKKDINKSIINKEVKTDTKFKFELS
jgi:hypothetical protein